MRVLKEFSNEISPILSLLDEWRQANVSLVFKKGEKYDAELQTGVSHMHLLQNPRAGDKKIHLSARNYE